VNWEPLVGAAVEARQQAYQPYSSFAVGAAVRTRSGKIFRGCNIENRTFGLTLCAERVAVAAAIVEGERDFEAAVVVTDVEPPAPPCGLCREVLTEFGNPDLPILLVNLSGDREEYRLRDLLPNPFLLPPTG
jgi:cytidine deaminase